MENYVHEEMQEGPKLFHDTVEWLEHYYIFPDPTQSRLCALFVFETYLARPVLPLVFYIGLGGPMSSGKTTLLEILRDLSWNGIMSGDVKVAALSRMLDRGCSLFVDEADEMDEDQRDLVYGSARRGYRRGSTRIVSVQSGKNWEPMTINIYGCYAFSFYNDADVDPALLSRMIKFDVPRLRTDETKDKVFLNMARTINGETSLKARFRTFTESALKEWNPQKAADRLLEVPFQERTLKLVGVTGLSRDLEIAATMLLVSDIAGINIVEELSSAFSLEARADIDEGVFEQLEDLRDVFLARNGPDAIVGSRMRFEDLRHEWNSRRRQFGDKPLDGPGFKGFLTRLGFRRGNGLVHPQNRSYVVWTDIFEQRVTKTTSPEPKIDLTRYLGQPNTVNPVRSQEQKVRLLRELGLGQIKEKEAFSHTSGIALTRDDFVVLVKDKEGFTEQDVDSILKHWLEKGDIYSPRNGEYRFT